MRYRYYNANPRQRKVNDCTVRAISLATNKTWEETFLDLSTAALEEKIMPDDVHYIDRYLEKTFDKIFLPRKITVEEFVNTHSHGIYLITMRGHITCCIDGCIYDTFNPRDFFVWDAYEIKR